MKEIEELVDSLVKDNNDFCEKIGKFLFMSLQFKTNEIYKPLMIQRDGEWITNPELEGHPIIYNLPEKYVKDE